MSSTITHCDFVVESKNTQLAMTKIHEYLKPLFPTDESSGSIVKTIKLNESIISVELPAELASFCKGITPWDSCPRTSPTIKCITSNLNTLHVATNVARTILAQRLPYTGVKIDCSKVYPSQQPLLKLGDNLDEIDSNLEHENGYKESSTHLPDPNEVTAYINEISLDSWFLKNQVLF